MIYSMKPYSHVDHMDGSCTRSIILTLATIALTYSTGTFAQSEDKVKTGLDLWRGSGCAECHGAFANGERFRLPRFHIGGRSRRFRRRHLRNTNFPAFDPRNGSMFFIPVERPARRRAGTFITLNLSGFMKSLCLPGSGEI